MDHELRFRFDGEYSTSEDEEWMPDVDEEGYEEDDDAFFSDDDIPMLIVDSDDEGYEQEEEEEEQPTRRAQTKTAQEHALECQACQWH
jgi:hypothetical protein